MGILIGEKYVKCLLFADDQLVKDVWSIIGKKIIGRTEQFVSQ